MHKFVKVKPDQWLFNAPLAKHIQRISLVSTANSLGAKTFNEKVILLKEILPGLYHRTFSYRHHHTTSSSHTDEALPLKIGQDSLLDLFKFLLDYVSIVLSQKSLWHDALYAIARREEFIDIRHQDVQSLYWKCMKQYGDYLITRLGKTSVTTNDATSLEAAANYWSCLCWKYPKKCGEPTLAAISSTFLNEANTGSYWWTTCTEVPDTTTDSTTSKGEIVMSISSKDPLETLEQVLSRISVYQQSQATSFIKSVVPYFHKIAALESSFEFDIISSFFVSAIKSNSLLFVLALIPAWIQHFEFVASSGTSTSEENVVWRYLPGYYTLVRANVVILKSFCQSAMKQNNFLLLDRVLECQSIILQNYDLLNPLFQVSLSSINLYDSQTIEVALNVMDTLLKASAYENGHYVMSYSCNDSIEISQTKSNSGYVPPSFDLSYFQNGMSSLLSSYHFQILLKTLTFLYNVLDLFERRRRKVLVSTLVLHQETFFKLFLHWNDEVRRVFQHILVYKLFVSSRVDLPCLSDQVLLNDRSSRNVLEGGGWYLAKAAYLLGVSPPVESQVQQHQRVPEYHQQYHPTAAAVASVQSPLSNDNSHPSAAFDRLKEWNSTSDDSNNSSFVQGLSDEEVSLDLSFASKVDVMLKMLTLEEGKYFNPHIATYRARAVNEYAELLKNYYQVANRGRRNSNGTNQRDNVNIPEAPELEFHVQTTPNAAGVIK